MVVVRGANRSICSRITQAHLEPEPMSHGHLPTNSMFIAVEDGGRRAGIVMTFTSVHNRLDAPGRA